MGQNVSSFEFSEIRTMEHLTTVLTRMCTEVNNIDVLSECFSLLKSYLFDMDEGEEHALQVLEAGGLEAIATIMVANSDNPDLLTSSCYTAFNALGLAPMWTGVSKTGLTEAIATAMDSFPTEEELQGIGCSALACVAFDVAEGPLMLRNGYVKTVLRDIRAMPENEAVQCYGMLFLSSVSVDLATQSKLCAMGVPDLIISCMRTHMDNSIILEGASSALANVSFLNTGAQIELIKRGAVDVIADVMFCAASSDGIMGYCSRGLSFLFSTEEAVKRYSAKKAIEAVKKVEDAHPTLKKVRHSRMSIEREEDPIVTGCVARGVCVNTGYPLCSPSCKSSDGMYCPVCCVQQRSYVCTQCDGEFSDSVYCESCWNKYHKGHSGKMFFFASRCRNV